MRSEKTNNRAKGMRVKSGVKAGCDQSGTPGLMTRCTNHNQTIAKGLRVKSSIKVGFYHPQHNHTLAHDRQSKR